MTDRSWTLYSSMKIEFYPLDEVSSAELAEGLEKISKETAKRLLLQKEQR
jgi:hypothetical protein